MYIQLVFPFWGATLCLPFNLSIEEAKLYDPYVDVEVSLRNSI